MSWIARRLLTATLAVMSTALIVEAGSINTSNSSPSTPDVLGSGQLSVAGDLSANSGRPDTYIQEYDPTYQHPMAASDDNSSTLGNGFASELTVPLDPNGAAYFRVIGPANASSPNAWGQYTYQFTVMDSHHNVIQTLPPQYENVTPGMVDNIWLDPSSDPTTSAARAGGFVTVTLNNVVGPGTGDSLNFYQFSGLSANQPFTAQFNFAGFPALIGVFNDHEQLVSTSSPGGTVTGVADAFGQVIIGVTGAGDSGFIGQHDQVGSYAIEVIPQTVSAPEPASAALLSVGGAIAAYGWLRRRRNEQKDRERCS